MMAKNSVNKEDNDDISDVENEEFFDACDEPEDSSSFVMQLEYALEEGQISISHFFNNEFEEAVNLMKPYADISMYHSMGYSVFVFLRAILTFESKQINDASEKINKCLEVCMRNKKKYTLSGMVERTFRNVNYNQLTDTECHAELCYAEALLLKALLTFVEDETLTSLIRGGLKIRQCYNSYKECDQILKNRCEWESESNLQHFKSGVKMGLGSFNLLISILPSNIIRLLEFIGFSGNKIDGLKDLKMGYEILGLRKPLCALGLLGYHLIVCQVLTHEAGDLVLCDDILTQYLCKHPKSVWFLFFKGRLEFVKAQLQEAEHWYIKSWKSQSFLTQFHHLCFWELLWINCLKLNWHEANIYATYLLENSKWSKTIYSYQKTSVLLMKQNLTGAEQEEIVCLMRQAPLHKQRIAGKSLPMEKFICKKTERYFKQNRQLCLPAIELMYLWNAFEVIKNNNSNTIGENIHNVIDKEMLNLINKKILDNFDFDNLGLCYLLRGVCRRNMKKNILALEDFESCKALHNKILEDNYIVPYACVETAYIYAAEANYEMAITILQDTKKKYTKFYHESRLNFKIHAALMEFRTKCK